MKKTKVVMLVLDILMFLICAGAIVEGLVNKDYSKLTWIVNTLLWVSIAMMRNDYLGLRD